jgi:hypothetical protein
VLRRFHHTFEGLIERGAIRGERLCVLRRRQRGEGRAQFLEVTAAGGG